MTTCTASSLLAGGGNKGEKDERWRNVNGTDVRLSSPVYDPPLSFTKSSTTKGRSAKSGCRTNSNTEGCGGTHLNQLMFINDGN